MGGPRASTRVALAAQTGIAACKGGGQLGRERVRPIPAASGVWEPSHWAIQQVGVATGSGEVSVAVDVDMVRVEVGEAAGCGQRACRISSRRA